MSTSAPNRNRGPAISGQAPGFTPESFVLESSKIFRSRLRLAAEGKKRAIVAVAHHLLVLAYYVLVTGRAYQERGPGVVEEQQKHRCIRHHARALGRSGVNVP